MLTTSSSGADAGATFQIRRALADDIDGIAPLFNAYRQFYRWPSDLGLCQLYLRERYERKESVLFVAEMDATLLGFVQLYPGFASLAAARPWTLYDLFVAPECRGLGVADGLMATAEAFARADGAVYLLLETAKDNIGAQKLYERRGYQRDTEFFSYCLDL